MLGIREMFASLDGHDRYAFELAVVVVSQSKRARAEQATERDWRHGLARYGYGCRCSVCRAANTEYMREYQRRRASDPVFRAQRRSYDKKRREARKQVSA